MTSNTAIHLVDEGVYLIERRWGLTWEVAGIPAPTGQDFTTPSLDDIVQVDTQVGALIAWRDADGAELSADDHAAQLKALLAAADNDEDGNPVFSTLEAEYAWRKFRARWVTQVRAPSVITRAPVQFDVIEVRVRSGDPDIVSLWNSPKAGVDHRLYSLHRDGVMVRTAIEQCAEAGLVYDNSSHPSHLRFAKIDGEYAFNDRFDASARPFVGTLDQCKAEKAHSIRRVTEVVSVRAAKKQGVALKNAGTTVIALREIERALRAVRPKQDHVGALARATRALSEVITGLQADIAS